jgi:signal peptidase
VIIALIALVLALGLTIGMQSYLGSSTPQVAVTTESMEPTYQGFEEIPNTFFDPLDGDLLLVQKKKPANIHPGDVIVFDNPDNPEERIVHRVIDIKIDENGEYYFKTKGDNLFSNTHPDSWRNTNGWVPEDLVHGVIVFRVPFVGWIALEIQKEINRWLLILLAAGLLLLSFRDSKEATEEANKENGQINLFQKIKTGKILTLLKKEIISFTRSRKVIIIGIILGVFFLSFFSSLQGIFSSCRITLVNIEEPYSAPHHSSWKLTDNDSHSFIPLTIKLKSHGFFNHISSFEIKAFENKSQAYRWTTVYSFQGEKTIAAGVVLNTPETSGIYDIPIEIIPHCAGLFGKGKSSQYSIQVNFG